MIKTLLKVLFLPPLIFAVIALPFEAIGLSAIGRFFGLIGIVVFFMGLGGFFKPELPPELSKDPRYYIEATKHRHKPFW